MDALAVADAALAEDFQAAPPRILRVILNEKARALRNLNRIEAALLCHAEALQSAHEEGSRLAVAWQLVLVGKLFDKYLNRHAFVHACLAEARARYEQYCDEHGFRADDRQTWRHAILLDLFGSYYRRLAERDPTFVLAAEESYRSALQLQELCGNPDGIARTKCHLAYVDGWSAALLETHDPERLRGLRAAIVLFEEGLQHPLVAAEAARGRATRQAQRADLYFHAGQIQTAEDFVGSALRLAAGTNDLRAFITATLIQARIYQRTDRTRDAIRSLLSAKARSSDSDLFGLRRRINNGLVESALELNRRAQAFLLLSENDELVRAELQQFDFAYRTVFDIFRQTAPERADRYLFEGLKTETAGLVAEILTANHAARNAVAAFERMTSTGIQNAIHDLAWRSLGHSVKNKLNNVSAGLATAAAHLGADGADVEAELKALRQAIVDIAIAAPRTSETVVPKASVVESVRRVATEILGIEHVTLDCASDVELPGLSSAILDGAVTHLVENAEKAVAAAPPAAGVPYMHIAQQRDVDGSIRILLQNPGANPLEPPRRPSGAGDVHGFETAVRFLSYLGLECEFGLQEDGPHSKGHQSNCVTITVPVSTRDRGYRIEPYCPPAMESLT